MFLQLRAVDLRRFRYPNVGGGNVGDRIGQQGSTLGAASRESENCTMRNGRVKRGTKGVDEGMRTTPFPLSIAPLGDESSRVMIANVCINLLPSPPDSVLLFALCTLGSLAREFTPIFIGLLIRFFFIFKSVFVGNL